MTNADLQHFDSYRDQTRIKHRILQQYLWAFLTALKGTNDSLIYIDAFAGRGRYREDTNEHDGSPLLAIKMLAADKDLRTKVKATFVEREPAFAEELKRIAESLPETGQIATAPQFVNLDFAAFMDQYRQSGSEFQRSHAPVFLFVDPCGVNGVKLSDVVEVLKRDQSEVFVFFNYEGVSRICGAAAASGESSTLNDLLGTPKRVAALLKCLASAKSSTHREQYILAAYRAALSDESGARYTLAYRVEAEERRSTSHYFLHAAKHSLGFTIMKHVMWEASVGGSSIGGLELLESLNNGATAPGE